ncbi:DUF3152 domain-containing protein [Actinotalea sp. AC32]|nr:DUF3152 domain-containing protein [Actinotalea sp. AC32]
MIVPRPSAPRRARHVSERPAWAWARRRRFAGRSVVLGAVVAVLAGAGAGVALEGPLGLGGAPGVTAEAEQVEVGAAGTVGPDEQRDGGAAPAADAPTPAPAAGGPATTPTPIPTPIPTPAPTPTPQLVAEPAPAVDGLGEADRAAGLLALDVPASGTGVLVVVPGEEPAPAADRRVVRVRVEVEEALPVDGAVFARMVMDTLNDPRGWGADGSVSFARTAGEADARVVLATPATVDALCAPLRTHSIYSCGRNGHAALNYMRWVRGADEFTDMTQYRQYLVNHEVGHLLGRPHVRCPGAGQVAPVMQQQTIQVAPCVPNGWPFPG